MKKLCVQDSEEEGRERLEYRTTICSEELQKTLQTISGSSLLVILLYHLHP